MIAINNSALISYVSGIGVFPINMTLFTPGATWAYNSGAKTVTVTDAAVIVGPDTFSKANVSITDNNGASVVGVIVAAAGNTGALDVSGLNLAGPLTIQVTEASTKGVQGSGQSNWVNATNNAGSIGYWEVTASTAE